MTSATTPTVPADHPEQVTSATAPRKWKTPILLAVLTLIALIPFTLMVAPENMTGINIVGDQRPEAVVPSQFTNLLLCIPLIAITAFAALRAWQRKPISIWFLAIFGFFWLNILILWIGNGAAVPVALTWLLTSTVALATPLVFGAMAGIVSERAGVVNIAIEGQLLAGAFTGALVSSLTQNAYVGLIAAMIAGALVSLILAVFGIKYWVEQVVVGVVINMIVIGLTSFFLKGFMSDRPEIFNNPVKYPRWNIPLLSDIPVLGPLLFQHTLITYLMLIAVPLLTFLLFRTRWGLRTRAVGEHPKAADTVGINVNRTRFNAVILSGLIAGAGGTFYTLGEVGKFSDNITSGHGYIALAAVIFGRWHPIYATAAALLFGFANAAAALASQVGAAVPSEFLAMVPYIITVFAVIGFVGQSRAPAADGVPYIK
ncbi:ABC transporter permease [Gulosibacter macacae]|uniref:ABC transporter permease n=1 Tax=Gulosibacter macacae TaxID=2488791 RepID=A0A3P3VWK9_9MICO|nr:ABC transporter permease [Gulosibacter macacae]RRJ86824.1 ABC transporter permease [Gulosibacter macacae]